MTNNQWYEKQILLLEDELNFWNKKYAELKRQNELLKQLVKEKLQ